MSTLNFNTLRDAARVGGAVALVRKEHLVPVGGYDELVAAALYPGKDGSVNQYLDRNVDGEAVNTVTLGSKQDQLNRIEAAIDGAPEESALTKVPRSVLTYKEEETLPEKIESDLTLSHRIFDAHLMFGTVEFNGKVIPVTEHPDYVAVRDTLATDAWTMLRLSPATLVFGGWDSARKSGQTRIPSSVVGDTYGVLVDQSPVNPESAPIRNAVKRDSVGSSYDLSQSDLDKFAVLRRGDSAKKAKAPSNVGLGPVPGTSLAGAAVKDIVRSTIISLNTLRTLRFGDHYTAGVSKAEGDATVRALLVAFVLAGRAYADLDGFLRANCHLVVDGVYDWTLIGADGSVIESFTSPTPEQADVLLDEAIAEAAKVGLVWDAQRFEITGNPVIRRKATADEPGA